MPPPPKTRKPAPSLPKKERRLQPDAGLLARIARAMVGWMRRPVGVYRIDGRWRAGLVERRRAPADALALRGMLDELQERLLAQEPGYAQAQLGELVQVHDQMRLKGWAGVVALPEFIRSNALAQAQKLARESPVPRMSQLIDRLRTSLLPPPSKEPVASPAPSASRSIERPETEVEVSEASTDEFEASQRGWLDTVPPLQKPTPAANEPST
jgi:hypothetical protein